MSKEYGFYIEEYDNGESIETLMTGDGKTLFTDMIHEDGTVGLGLSYGCGKGIGVKENHPANTHATDIGVKWQVRFECPKSIDAMIEALNRAKTTLIESSTL